MVVTRIPATAKRRGATDGRICYARLRQGRGRLRTAKVTPMQKWEYATVPLLVHATKQILDNWGEDGWELVAVVPGPNPEQLVAYMKRPRT